MNELKPPSVKLENPGDGGASIVRLETAEMREARLEADHRAVIKEEAIENLERMIEMVKERGVAGLAIAVVFEDNTYGRIIPKFTTNMAGLIGAVASAQHDLIFKTLTEEL